MQFPLLVCSRVLLFFTIPEQHKPAWGRGVSWRLEDQGSRWPLLLSRDGSLDGLPVRLELQRFIKIEKYAHILRVTAASLSLASSFILPQVHPLPSLLQLIYKRTGRLFMGTKLSLLQFVVVCLTEKVVSGAVLMHHCASIDWISAWRRGLMSTLKGSSEYGYVHLSILSPLFNDLKLTLSLIYPVNRPDVHFYIL